MIRARITFGLIVAALLCAIPTSGASASRPFDYAVLHKPTQDDQRLRLVVKTVTGIEKPDALTLRASGVHAHAKEIKGSVGRWAVNMGTDEGKALISAVKEGFDLGRFSKLHAVGYYDWTCATKFRVLFKIEGFNQRDDWAQFRRATDDCDRARSTAASGEQGLFGPAYFSTSVTKDGESLELVDDKRLKVDFDHERSDVDVVRWSSGCNFFGTKFVIENERLITKNNSPSTQIGCAREARRQDRFFYRFFEHNPALVTSGNGLQLSNDRVVIELQRKH